VLRKIYGCSTVKRRHHDQLISGNFLPVVTLLSRKGLWVSLNHTINRSSRNRYLG